MPKAKKIYTVVKTDKWGKERTTTGTVEELVCHFGYTLEVGNSYNRKINRNPKTIDSFLKNYNNAVDIKYGGFDRPYLSLVEETAKEPA